jgi:hypothetical protein
LTMVQNLVTFSEYSSIVSSESVKV